MLYAIFCYHTEAEVCAWPQEKEDAVLAQRARAKSRMAAQGKLGPVARLMPTTAATTVRSGGGESMVFDGPFAETKEQLLGFYVFDCANLDEAIAIAREMVGDSGAMEVRPISRLEPGVLSTTPALSSTTTS